MSLTPLSVSFFRVDPIAREKSEMSTPGVFEREISVSFEASGVAWSHKIDLSRL